MEESRIFDIVLAFTFFRLCLCIGTRFKRTSSSPTRFAETSVVIEGISVLECAVLGKKADVLAINYRVETNTCELIAEMDICNRQESDEATWQAYRVCEARDEGRGIKTVTQSSDHINYRPATLAIDGNYSTVSHTALEPLETNPWWLLEFCFEVVIVGVKVWNRGDCCAYQLRNIDITVDDQLCGHIHNPPGLGNSVEVTCSGPLIGRFLKLQRMETNPLNLAEVEPIFGDNSC